MAQETKHSLEELINHEFSNIHALQYIPFDQLTICYPPQYQSQFAHIHKAFFNENKFSVVFIQLGSLQMSASKRNQFFIEALAHLKKLSDFYDDHCLRYFAVTLDKK